MIYKEIQTEVVVQSHFFKELLHFKESCFRNSVIVDFTRIHLLYKMRYMCVDTGKALSLLPAGRHCFYFISLYSLVPHPPPQRHRLRRNRVSRHTEMVFVVSQDTVSCWQGSCGLGLPQYSRWEKQRNTTWLGLALILKSLAGCFQLCWGYFLQLGQKKEKKKERRNTVCSGVTGKWKSLKE